MKVEWSRIRAFVKEPSLTLYLFNQNTGYLSQIGIRIFDCRFNYNHIILI